MNLTPHRSDDFNRDFDLQYRWYLEQAGEAVANRCYRPEPFPSDRHRVEYLFALYETLTAPLVAAAKPARKGRRTPKP